MVPTIKERLKACNQGPYKAYIPALLRSEIRPNRSFVDDKKVSDHHAIIPTEEAAIFSNMTNEERRIYDLVVRRFLSVLYPPFEYEQTSLKADLGGELFAAEGQTVLSKGWKTVYEDADAAEKEAKALPTLKKGSVLTPDQITLTSGKTTPLPRFTEATLLSAMENPLQYMESRDSRERKALTETGGLGTVATRADIIEKLFHSFLIEKKGQEILLTSKGKQLLSLVPEDLKKPELTARWEMELSDIAKGKSQEEPFIRDIESYTQELIQEIRTAEGQFRHDNLTNTKCPRCGKRMLAVNGKNSRLLVCQDRECGYRETIARLSNARCPNCHKKMELLKKGGPETFVCSCGYKEKLDAFKKRREKEGAGVSKKDVRRYLNNQKEESVGNTFAQALSGIKLDK